MTTFSACETPDILRVIYFIKIIIDIIKIVVPIGLIIMISFDCAKGVVANEKKVGDILKVNKNRIISAILIFCIPTIVNIVLKIIDEETSYESCWVNANSSDIAEYQVLWDAEEERRRLEEEKKQEENIITSDSSITFTYEWITNDALPYALYTPSTAEQNKKTPLIVWLHGSGEMGVSEHVFKNNGLPAVLNKWKLEGFNAYVLCPRSPGDWKYQVDKVYTIIDNVIESKNIDTKRIVLVGHSMGSRGVYLVSNGKLDYYSALVFLSPYPESVELEQYKNIPIRGYVGTITYDENGKSNGEDPRCVDYVNKTFRNTFGEENTFEVDTWHGNVPNAAFNLDENHDNKSDLIEWMLTQKKK